MLPLICKVHSIAYNLRRTCKLDYGNEFNVFHGSIHVKFNVSKFPRSIFIVFIFVQYIMKLKPR